MVPHGMGPRRDAIGISRHADQCRHSASSRPPDRIRDRLSRVEWVAITIEFSVERVERLIPVSEQDVTNRHSRAGGNPALACGESLDSRLRGNDGILVVLKWNWNNSSIASS